jgi:20S proteasome alpha/beta subunit
MTLIAAFRASAGGILLCADREENDGFAKRDVSKISRWSNRQFQMFIAGAGSTAIIKKTQDACELAMNKAVQEGADIEAQHHEILERALEATYARYVKDERDQIALLIVAAVEKEPRVPFLYRSQSTMLIREEFYAAEGSGKFISDFLADRMYSYVLGKPQLLLLASFIFREAGEAVSGVGLGAEMVLIYNGDRSMQFYGPGNIRDLQAGIPKLAASIYSHWTDSAKLPEWWRD